MTHATVEQRKIDREKRAAVEAIEDQILTELGIHMPAPTISNVRVNPSKRGESAWLSWRRDVGSGSNILAALEAAGWKSLPATLAQYGDWRRSVWPGFQHQLPEESSRATLKDSEPIAPLWIVPNQHTGPEAIAFYTSPSGLVCRVLVTGPNGVYITAKKIEYSGGWRFERGTAKLRYPESWHSVYVSEEASESIAQICVHSRAYVDTEQGLSGAIYFTPFLDHGEFPLTPAQFLKQLETTALPFTNRSQS